MKRYVKTTVVPTQNLADEERVDVAFLTSDKDVLSELSEDPDFDVKWALLLNKSTPKDILMDICQELPSAYALLLAQNPNTSSNLLSVFLTVYGRYSAVGSATLNNPNYRGG